MEERVNAAARREYGIKATMGGTICNLLLFALKLTAGVLANSVSVITDAVNNLSDAASSIIALFGFRLSQKPADYEHPYGHGRYEYLAGIIVATLIIAVGGALLMESIQKIINPAAVRFTHISFIILIIGILIKIGMMICYRRVGKKIESQTLIAAAADSRNDALSTIAVLLGAVISRVYGIIIDGYVGAAVALFILISGAGIIKDTLDPALGRVPDQKTIEHIRQKIMSYDGILGTHDLMVHDYGVDRLFASVHVEMAGESDAITAHGIVDRIERDFLDKDGIHLIIHYDPLPLENSELGTLRKWITDNIKMLDERITIHDLHMEGEDVKTVSLDCVVPPDINIGDEEIKKYVANIVNMKYGECICDIRIDKGYTEIAR